MGADSRIFRGLKEQYLITCEFKFPGELVTLSSNRETYLMRSVYEIIHIWTAAVKKSEEWSSQLIFQFKQLERSLKKSGLQRDWNPWPPRYRCDALPTELWSHTLGARSIYWVHISREEWNDAKCIWNNSYLNCSCKRKWRTVIAVNFPI